MGSGFVGFRELRPASGIRHRWGLACTCLAGNLVVGRAAIRVSAVHEAIHTEADTLTALHQAIRDAEHCHLFANQFEEGQAPPLIPASSRFIRNASPREPMILKRIIREINH